MLILSCSKVGGDMALMLMGKHAQDKAQVNRSLILYNKKIIIKKKKTRIILGHGLLFIRGVENNLYK